MRTTLKLTLGLLLGCFLGLHADEPKTLAPDQEKEIAALKEQVHAAIGRGEFEAAEEAARQVAALRGKWQGRDYWETIDARLEVELWQRLTKVSKKNRAEVARAVKTIEEGAQLLKRARYREAEEKQREALAISLKVLGEQHPATASNYHQVSLCLYQQGKRVEALPLLLKALDIWLKTLGEQHPDTARGYSGVAYCLDALGKYAEALPLHQKALDISLKVLGEQHPATARGYSGVAICLNAQAKYAEALPLFQKALDISLKVLGEQHPDIATRYNNLASCLRAQGKHAEALPLFQKALDISLKVLGEQHPDIAISYNNLAHCLNNQAMYAEALPLFQKALAICLETLGEQHPNTASSYNNLAHCLDDQGKHAEALPLFQKALDISLKVLGEQHPDTAISYNNVAGCLNAQGKHNDALALYKRALAVSLETLGEQHPDTVNTYNNVASCLQDQGNHAEAVLLYRKALGIWQKVLGEQHPLTATTYNNLALCLLDQGKHAEALPLCQKSLAISEKVLGEQHPLTASSYNSVAACLDAQGKHTEAVLLHRKALAICQKVLGEQHPRTSGGYKNVADCLYAQGKHAEAAEHWEKALFGFESGRLSAADSGFNRALFQANNTSPRAALAATLVRLGKVTAAWEHAETDLGRSLLDELGGRAKLSQEDEDKVARVQQLNQALLPLLTRTELDAEQEKQRDTLVEERDKLLAELARGSVARSLKRVLPLKRIQKQIPVDAAVVFWLDALDQHLGCVLRHEGEPAWVHLLGSDQDDAWTAENSALPSQVLTSLTDGRTDAGTRQKRLEALRRQRLTPLEKHLEGVKHLLVVPSGWMAAVPVESLTQRYTVSYVPSASHYAHTQQEHRPLEATSLLVLADPEFQRPVVKLPPAPEHGLLITAVTPDSLAARIRLAPGDVLMEYDGVALKKVDDLKPSKDERIPLRLWREGRTLQGRIPGGALGVVVDKRPVAEALAAWRERDKEVVAALRGKDWQPLPGTRLEARSLAALFPEARLLLGSDASEQNLDELAGLAKLKGYRLLHLATHGEANPIRPELTALILAQDRLPTEQEQAARVLAGKRPLEGRLDVTAVLEKWDLDADLVVLSACETGRGKYTHREGMLGFTQALMQKGARSVVLSRWKVDDGATALLMTRFYQNLLGKREGLKKAMSRAEALREAKSWLRTLSRDEAQKRLAALVDGVPRGERGSIKAALPTHPADAPKGEADCPYAHPFYWAAFVLLGDPD